MFHLNNLCSLCLTYNKKLAPRSSINSRAKHILRRVIPEYLQQKSEIPRKICDDCLDSLNEVFQFRRKCLENISIFNEYVRQLQEYGSYKCLSVPVTDIKLDIKKEINKDILLNEDTCFEENVCPNFLEINIKQENSNDGEYIEEHEENNQRSDVIDIKKEINEETILNEDKCILEDDLQTNCLKTDENINQENYNNREFSERQDKNYQKSDDTPSTFYESDIGKTDEPKNQDIDFDERIKCTECGEEFQNCMLDIDSPKCQKCQTIPDTNNPNESEQATKKPHSCSTCQKSFRCISLLKTHQRVHSGERPFSCNICGKKFTQFCNVQLHQRVHTKNRPFVCEICQKSFVYAYELRRHNLTHLDKRPFECDICQKSFKRADDLKKHKDIHTGTKRFQCEICQKRFVQKNNLTKHKMIHFGKKSYKCNLCEKTFLRSDSLKFHEKVHSAGDPYGCNMCEKKFKSAHYLRLHKLLHAEKPPTKV